MKKVAFTFLWLLLTLETVSAQEAGARALPNWLTGIIAVVAFLFLVFVAFLVNKAWCGDSSHELKALPVKTNEDNEHGMKNGTHNETSLDMVRTSDHENAYENVAIQNAEDDKITVM